MSNWETTFVKLIKEICGEEGITLSSFDDWAFCLTKDGRRRFIYGYQFGLDAASASGVVKDKAAAAAFMEDACIPCVPHFCVMSPAEPAFCTLDSGWRFLEEKLSEYGSVVVKDNLGTGGRSIYRASDMKELEKAANMIFATAQSLSVSPYLPLEDEYRVIMYGGEPELVFRKERPFVTGDGRSCVGELAARVAAAFGGREAAEIVGAAGAMSKKELLAVPEAGERVHLIWKHNLGQGAKPEVIDRGNIPTEVINLAGKAAQLFGLKFCSVDVVSCGDRFMIMEINGGVMMENLANYSKDYFDIAKNLYRKAIRGMFTC